MAVSPVGNLTFINQNSQVGANFQANAQHRVEIANMANLQDYKHKLQEVQEVRRLEENEAINPDADSQKHKGDHQAMAQHKEEKKEEEKLLRSDHLLDIKV